MNTGKEELKRLLNEAPKDLKCMWERLDAPRLPRNATFDSRKLEKVAGEVAWLSDSRPAASGGARTEVYDEGEAPRGCCSKYAGNFTLSAKLEQNLYGYVANNCLHLFLKKFALNFERIANNCAEL